MAILLYFFLNTQKGRYTMLKRALLSTVIAVSSVTPIMAYSNQSSVYDESLIAKGVYVGTDFDVNINSKSLFFTNINGENFAKLRSACELYGYDIDWKQGDKSIVIIKNDTKYELKIGSSTILENGISRKTVGAPILLNSSTYIPYDVYSMIFKSEVSDIKNNKYNSVNRDVLDTLEGFYNGQQAFIEELSDAYKNYYYEIGYEVLEATDILSLRLYNFTAMGSSNTEEKYLNYDNTTLLPVTLEDVLGEGYEEDLRSEILSIMKEREAIDNQVYLYWYEEFEKAPLDDSRSFYFNRNNDLVIVFDKYEISPGAMGKQEFIISDNDKVEDFRNVSINNFYETRFEKFKNYLDLYDFKNSYNLLGYNTIEVLNLFGSPDDVYIKDIDYLEDSFATYVYKANSEDSTYVYIYFKKGKVFDYKVDEFNGSF